MALNLDHQRDRITTSTGNMTINTAGSLRIPVGNTSQRPQAGVVQTGQIRFNTQLNEFEGYNGTAWKNIGGVSDTDGDTFIDAEQSADDDILRFFTAGSERITINDTGIVAISTATQSTTFNDGALTVAGGVGIVKDLNVGGNINVTGNVTVGGTINLGDDDTDNINITGESFDYGPYRFLGKYEPNKTAAYFDRYGLYRFSKQADAIFWNVQQLASIFTLMIDKEHLVNELKKFVDLYNNEVIRLFFKRLMIKPNSDTGKNKEFLNAFYQILGDQEFSFEEVYYDLRGGLEKIKNRKLKLFM